MCDALTKARVRCGRDPNHTEVVDGLMFCLCGHHSADLWARKTVRALPSKDGVQVAILHSLRRNADGTFTAKPLGAVHAD